MEGRTSTMIQREELTCRETDRAITLTGSGKFQLRITVVCGLCFMAAAFQNGLNAFVLPAAQCDLHMDSQQMGMLNVAFMAGSIASAYMWGVLADLCGRKKLLAVSLVIDATVTILSSLSQTYAVFTMFRFFNGFLIGAAASLVFPYLGEFHTSKHGTRSSCYAGFFWTLAWMLLPGLAWIIIPIQWQFRSFEFVFNSWRIFICVLSLPSIIAATTLSFHPESPRFLLSKGRLEEALGVLQEMFACNTGKPRADYPAILIPTTATLELSPDILKSQLNISTKNDQEDGKSFRILIHILWNQTKPLFMTPILKYTVLCSMLLFTNMFGYFGLGLWLPELFNRFESFYRVFPNETISVCELNAFFHSPEQMNVSKVQTSSDAECSSQSVEPDVFVNTLTVGVVCIFGNIICGALAGRYQRWIMPVMTMLIAGISGLSIYFVESSTSILIISCIFQASISSANFVISGIIVELFPTNIRAMAICTAILAGRLGAVASNMLFGQLLDVQCEVPILLVGGVVIVGGLLAFFIPNNKNNEETTDEDFHSTMK